MPQHSVGLPARAIQVPEQAQVLAEVESRADRPRVFGGEQVREAGVPRHPTNTDRDPVGRVGGGKLDPVASPNGQAPGVGDPHLDGLATGRHRKIAT